MAFVGRPALGVRVLRCFSAVMRPGSLEPARQPIRFCGRSPVTAGSGQPTHRNVRHDLPTAGRPGRSEEHTSELQSLMRISYAVFCLKKKKTNKNISTTPQ